MIRLEPIHFILLLCFSLNAESNTNTLVKKSLTSDTFIYKVVEHKELKLFVYHRAGKNEQEELLPAIIFFHGGGWKSGKPQSFAKQAVYMARQGLVAITVDYRLKNSDHTGPVEAVEDALSAIEWVRRNASELGVNRNRIVASGGSAGGHLALATAMFGVHDKHRDDENSAMPDALILFNPVLDLSGKWEIEFNTNLRTVSPIQNIRNPLPPTVIFQGDADKVTPFTTAEQFVELARMSGSKEIRLIRFENRHHGFFHHKEGEQSDFDLTMQQSVLFLRDLGWIS